MAMTEYILTFILSENEIEKIEVSSSDPASAWSMMAEEINANSNIPATATIREDGTLLIHEPSEADSKSELLDYGHPAVSAIMQWFDCGHLPEHLQEVSEPIGAIAHRMACTLRGPELTAGLRKLLEAKDCFVRARLVGYATE